jgi:hypothetical protein
MMIITSAVVVVDDDDDYENNASGSIPFVWGQWIIRLKKFDLETKLK